MAHIATYKYAHIYCSTECQNNEEVRCKVCDRIPKVTEIKDLFDLFDQDKNGKITKQEILNTFNNLRLPITEQHAEKLISEFDSNGDSELQLHEFVNLIKKYLNDSDYPTQEMFNHFDRDGDGFITLEEFLKSMRCVGIDINIDAAAKMMEGYYLTGAQKISYTSFDKMMRQHM